MAADLRSSFDRLPVGSCIVIGMFVGVVLSALLDSTGLMVALGVTVGAIADGALQVRRRGRPGPGRR